MSAKSSRARAGIALAWGIVVVVVLSGAAFFAPRLPIGPAQNAVGWLAGELSLLPPLPFIAVLLAVVATLVAWRIGRRALFAAGVVASVAAALVVVVPWLAAWRTASALGTTVSWSQYFDDPAEPSPTETTSYATVGGQRLGVDVFRPEHVAASKPAVLFVHGGGWRGGTRSDDAVWLKWIADQGIVVFSIDYRLTLPPRWQDAVGDVKCALGWIRSKADSYGISASNVSVAGGSAGGQLALIGAYTVGDPDFRPSCDVPEAPVASVLAWFAPTDLPNGVIDSQLPFYAKALLRDYLGGDVGVVRDRYDKSSAINHVRSGLPPTLLVHGIADRLVPSKQTETLTARLKAAGDSVDTVLLPWVDHSFTVHWGGWGSQVSRPAVRKFLSDHVIR